MHEHARTRRGLSAGEASAVPFEDWFLPGQAPAGRSRSIHPRAEYDRPARRTFPNTGPGDGLVVREVLCRESARIAQEVSGRTRLAVTVFQTHSHQAVVLVPVAPVTARPPLGAILSRPLQVIRLLRPAQGALLLKPARGQDACGIRDFIWTGECHASADLGHRRRDIPRRLPSRGNTQRVFALVLGRVQSLWDTAPAHHTAPSGVIGEHWRR